MQVYCDYCRCELYAGHEENCPHAPAHERPLTMKIFKYLLPHYPAPVVPMPRGAAILHAGHQDGRLTLWAMVDPSAPEEDRHFRIIGTGVPFDRPEAARLEHIGTVMIDPFVWHVFESIPAGPLRGAARRAAAEGANREEMDDAEAR